MTNTNPNRVTLAIVDADGTILEYGSSFSIGHPSTRTDFGPGALPMIERYAKRAGHPLAPADEQGYNGWTNYATWGVALVLSNDERTYHEHAQVIKRHAPDNENVPEIWTAEQAAIFTLEEWIKDYTEELCGLERDDDALSKVSPTMMAHQLLHAALAEVNWREIAENLLSELDD